MKQKFKTLEDLRNAIKEEKDYVDLKPFSHNIISLCLREIANKYGYEEANKAIKDFRLTKFGWHTQKVMQK